MNLFIDKYGSVLNDPIDKYGSVLDNPTENVKPIIFHKNELELLNRMAKDESIPHIIFYGPTGAGKKTLVKQFLQNLYNDESVHKLLDTPYKVYSGNNKATEVIIKQSNYHIIIEPNNNNFDKYLIQYVVKEYAKKIPLCIFTEEKPFKIVLINNIDNLSYYAQTSLRRTMEKYSSTCRFIMICRSLSSVIDPIRSRCFCFKIDSPSNLELTHLIMSVTYQEQMTLQLDELSKILNFGEGNIKQILWFLQMHKLGMKQTTLYDISIKTIFDKLLSNDLEEILSIRELIYKIMITNITGIQIMKDVLKKILKSKKVNETCKLNVAEYAAKYSHNLTRDRREMIHLEPFMISVMNIFNKYNK
jgi:replication factor C subunit 3/5